MANQKQPISEYNLFLSTCLQSLITLPLELVTVTQTPKLSAITYSTTLVYSHAEILHSIDANIVVYSPVLSHVGARILKEVKIEWIPGTRTNILCVF